MKLHVFHSALRGLCVYRLRSALTMLSVTVGVTAVILLVAIGNGVQASVNAKLDLLANQIIIIPLAGNLTGGTASPKDLTDADVAALEKHDQAPDIASVVPAAVGRGLVETDTTGFRATIVGTTEHWLEVQSRDLQVGHFFDEVQLRAAARVVVLGAGTATNLFGADPASALSRVIRINHQNFKVIGVIESLHEPGDNDVVMPLEIARRYIFGSTEKINLIIVRVARAAAVPAAEEEIIRILSDRHQIKESADRDFEVQSPRKTMEISNKVLRILAVFSASVAAISLIVGAIGILNVMLVSVAERTREIGILRAIGATRRMIFQQFLVESLLLAGLGGIIGVFMGITLSLASAAIAPLIASVVGSIVGSAVTVVPALTIPSVVLSFAISLAVGLAAGCYPAARAARLPPAEALRHNQ
jgi:putative ABC transport system permease protein